MKRQWLYKKDADATIFYGEEAIDKALKDEWVDTPTKISKVDTIEAVVIKPQVKAIKSKAKKDIIIEESDDEDKPLSKEEKTIKK